jgi:outer membrane protein assembly factor BamB
MMFRRLAVCTLCLASMGAWTTGARAENWPQWRGPRFDGTSQERGLPTTWSQTENVVWRTALPGPAGSTPAVWGERIFLTTADGPQEMKLLCLNTDGQLLWERLLGDGNDAVRGDEGNYASNSPATDGRLVWAMVANGPLSCFDYDGDEVWREDLAERYGRFNIAFGLSGTPVLDGDRLYVQLLHSDSNLIVCLDKSSGSEIWRHERQSDAHGEPLHAYASPMLYRDGQREFLLTHGADYIVAHRLEDGAEIWRCGGFNPPPGGTYREDFRFVSSPLPAPGMIVVPSCKNGRTVALDPDGTGDLTNGPKQRWAYNETPDVPSPLYHDGLVYLCGAGGILHCLEAESGAEVYVERVHDSRHRASPVLADGKIYLTARDGLVSVVKPGRQFELLAQNDLAEGISASPAVAGGRIYLRTFDALYAIGKK